MKQNLYNLKGAFEIKDMDMSQRKVSIYLSKFDSMDADGDVIRKGAFTKSIKERGPESLSNRKIAFLRHHDWEKQIGLFLELNEDDYGLYAVGQLGRSTEGEDALRDYEDGIIKEHSIGFQYIPDKMQYIEDSAFGSKGYTEIRELKLYEGSAVTFGSNEYTYVVDVKGEQKKEYINKLELEMNNCIKALSNGKGSDERLHGIEMKVKYLTSQLLLLADHKEESIDLDHSDEESEPAPKQEGFKWEAVISGLTQKQETFADYPQKAKDNAERGIRLNEEVNNRCATNVGKQRGRDIAEGRGLSLDVLKRTYSFLSRAKTYYDPADAKACGTISYLLWGGDAMLKYCERKLDQIDD